MEKRVTPFNYNKTTKKYTVTNITNGEYCAVGTSENFEVTKGNCE